MAKSDVNELAAWPFFADDERQAVDAVLRSGKVNYWTGTEGREFEREFADYIGVEHAIALANGTVALELALRVLGIGPGDEVVVTPRTFVASASSVVLQGATPVFADVDPDSQNITVDTVRRVLTPRTKAVIAVHLAGWPCDMPGLAALAAENGLKLIEDCAQAHGASIAGRKVGAFGDAAAFSFCQDKIISTGGEGGMLLLRDADAWDRAWAYKDHGKSYQAVYHRDHPAGFRWLHESFGTNWRMTEMQAAIGRRQLQKLDAWVAKRRRLAERLARHLEALPALRVPRPPGGIGHAYYKFYAFLRTDQLQPGWNQNRIVEEVGRRGVPCFSGSCGEVYRERAFVQAGIGPQERLPVAASLGETSLMFPVHPTLAETDIDRIAAVAADVIAAATAKTADA